MKAKLIVLVLVLVACFSIEAKQKKKCPPPPAFEHLEYTEPPFSVIRTSLDFAYVYGEEGAADGIHGPLPFWMFRGDLSDHEFRETLIFVVDNISEAWSH